ncbi:MAG: hypothetical protein Q8Q85_04305 [Gemmatimonadales bacterium]|nr:hypothetical protein [Gemmatimonadales bacterium]
MRVPLLASLLFVAAHSAAAQAPEGRAAVRIHLAAGAGSSTTVASAAATRDHALGFFRRARLGYGVRVTVIGGGDQAFGTADPDIPRSQREAVLVRSPLAVAANLEFYSSLRLLGTVAVGFDIDVVGIGAGPKRQADPASGSVADSSARATGFNLLRGGNADHGTLNSEFFLAVRVTPRMTLRSGLIHAVSEYSTSASRALGNDRFRKFVTVPFVAVTLDR